MLLVSIDFYPLVKLIDINWLIFINYIDYIDWFPIIDFHRLDQPGLHRTQLNPNMRLSWVIKLSHKILSNQKQSNLRLHSIGLDQVQLSSISSDELSHKILGSIMFD